jgi:hypothetical protein
MSGAPLNQPYTPMTIGQVLERIFGVLRANFRSIFAIAAVPGLSMFVTYGIAMAAVAPLFISAIKGGKPEEIFHLTGIFSALFLPIMLINLLVFAVYLAAASYAAVLADCGKPVSFGDAYRVACARVGRYLLLTLAIYAVAFLPALLLEVPMLASSALMGLHKTTPNPAFALLFPFLFTLIFAAFLGGALIALRLSLAFSASVFEGLGVRGAIKRSWALTRGALGRILIVALVMYAAIYIATMVLIFGVMSVGAIGFLLLGSHDHYSTQAITSLGVCVGLLYLGLMAIMTAGTWASFTAAFGVIYNDQRLRVDGLPPAQSLPLIQG